MSTRTLYLSSGLANTYVSGPVTMEVWKMTEEKVPAEEPTEEAPEEPTTTTTTETPAEPEEDGA